jgi:hypothetical protein
MAEEFFIIEQEDELERNDCALACRKGCGISGEFGDNGVG